MTFFITRKQTPENEHKNGNKFVEKTPQIHTDSISNKMKMKSGSLSIDAIKSNMDDTTMHKHHKHVIKEISKNMKTIMDTKIIQDIAHIEKLDLSDHSYFSECIEYSDIYDYCEGDLQTTSANIDCVLHSKTVNSEYCNDMNRMIKKKDSIWKNETTEGESQVTEDTDTDSFEHKSEKENMNEELSEQRKCEGILYKDIEDLFLDLQQQLEHTFMKSMKILENNTHKENGSCTTHANVNDFVENDKILVESEEMNGENDKNWKRKKRIKTKRKKNEAEKKDTPDKTEKTCQSAQKKKYNVVDYKVLCKTQKMCVIDVIEDPDVEQTLVNILSKVNLKVHWEDDDAPEEKNKNQHENSTKDKGKTVKWDTNTKIITDKKKKKNVTKQSDLKGNLKKTNVKSIIKNSKKENEFDAAIDLLKSYYKSKRTSIFYISDDGKSLLPGQISVDHKTINIQLCNDQIVYINIESIKNIKDHIPLSEYPKIKNIEKCHIIQIIYEKYPGTNCSFSIVYQDKLKLCLFLSLLKSYHRINFKIISENILELISKYNNGVTVKKISNLGNISQIKVIIVDRVIRFLCIDKMKGHIFDLIEDFISFETTTNASCFAMLNETEKNEIDKDSCIILHFTYRSMLLVFLSPDERDKFILLLLFLRQQN